MRDTVAHAGPGDAEDEEQGRRVGRGRRGAIFGSDEALDELMDMEESEWNDDGDPDEAIALACDAACRPHINPEMCVPSGVFYVVVSIQASSLASLATARPSCNTCCQVLVPTKSCVSLATCKEK